MTKLPALMVSSPFVLNQTGCAELYWIKSWQPRAKRSWK